MEDNPFEARLLSGERVVWTGAPARGLLLTGRDVFFIPFILVWCSVVSTSFISSAKGGPLPFDLFMVPFVCLGLFFLGGRFLLDAWLRGRTDYAVTDRRVLIQRAAPFSSFTTIDLLRLPEINLVDQKADRGTIRFGASGTGGRQQFSYLMPSLDSTPQFLAIRDAAAVLDFVLEASEWARSSREGERR